MRDRRIKLIYFSLKGSEIRCIELSWKKVTFFASALLLFLFVLVASIIGLFTDYYHNFKIKSLDRINMTLRNQLNEMREKVVHVQTKMDELEEIDDEERMIAGIDKIDKDMRSVGVGGTDNGYSHNELAIFPKETREEISQTGAMIEQLERRIKLLLDSREEIDDKIKNNKQKLKHTPSVRPVEGGRITDLFGKRLDPFIERVKMHEGIDIGVKVGTDVYATAAGVVKSVKNNYKLNKGYGREVYIDHGNGVVTHYAHLSQIYVKVGEKVDRWDLIAKSGSTGKSTGPHLHYGVKVNNKFVNPLLYILE